MIGTTHFTNAFVEAKDLLPLGVVRLCGPATRAILPIMDWPERLRTVGRGPCVPVPGRARI